MTDPWHVLVLLVALVVQGAAPREAAVWIDDGNGHTVKASAETSAKLW